MGTKKSHEIPEVQWSNAPNLQDWIDKSKEERTAQAKANKFDVTNTIFQSLKPSNADYMAQFSQVKGGIIQDIGVNDGVIWTSMIHGDLIINFADHRLLIEPHENGMVIDYHTFDNNILNDITSYIPSASGLTSCIFAFACENETFEYLIEPQGASTLSFMMTFTPHGANHA